MGSSAAVLGMPTPASSDPQAQSLQALIAALTQGQGGGGSAAPPSQGGAAQGSQDPWLQAQQQAQNDALAMGGPLNTPQYSQYQVDPGAIPQQNVGGGYNSGEDWVKNQAAAQADSDKRFGKAPGINYMGQTGPYGAVGDLAPNYLVARADQWAANGSGPAIAPAIQGAINEDPRLAGLYSNLPIQRINNVGNGFGVLPGALTPSAMFANGGQMPESYNELLKHTQADPGKPQGMANLGPYVAQYMGAHPVPLPPPSSRSVTDLSLGIQPKTPSFYDYSSPNGNPANSPGAQAASAATTSGLNPQLQMLAKLLMGSAQPAAAGGMTASAMTQPAQGAQPGANPLLSRSQTALSALSSYR